MHIFRLLVNTVPFVQNAAPAEEHYSFNLQPNNSVLLQGRMNTVEMNIVLLFVGQSTHFFNSAGTSLEKMTSQL